RSVLIGALAAASGAWGQAAPLTLSCGKPTERQTAGPYFKPNSPRRAAMMESGSNAALLVVTGLVLSTECKPVANALVDFWHADEFGEYDNKGFRYRGHQFTDVQGRWRLETVLPAEYPGRARHLHVNVQAPGKSILTTQLYFPGDRRDGLYRDSLVIRVDKKDDRRIEGSFNFVVEA
ncbi:MAG: intradiol ring-cleavage dioxygenase, partial [Betaproteobacteria bacterium]|nr:intradiol ring-cleavage dioxygenase [Betaproteobacteria bacterium]